MQMSSIPETPGVSIVRIYVLRAVYFVIFAGLALMIWPGIIHHPGELTHFTAVVRSFLGALSLLALLGIRYPLKMLPLLLFELVWKSIWLFAFALPRWSGGQLDPAMQAEFYDYVISVVLIAIVLPWRYMFTHYVKAPGERWRRRSGDSVPV